MTNSNSVHQVFYFSHQIFIVFSTIIPIIPNNLQPTPNKCHINLHIVLCFMIDDVFFLLFILLSDFIQISVLSEFHFEFFSFGNSKVKRYRRNIQANLKNICVYDIYLLLIMIDKFTACVYNNYFITTNSCLNKEREKNVQHVCLCNVCTLTLAIKNSIISICLLNVFHCNCWLFS